MNGVSMDEPIIDRRPIITCAGELEVFSTIEDDLQQALPQDTCEWRRSLGRTVRSVHIGANFAPFSPAALPKANQWDLVKQPVFHIYWTECGDLDLYKNSVKDDIESWLKELTNRDINDYLIVVVENFDNKRTNKLLPRTTVLDKIRTDFVSKQGDRCISVINPQKNELRTAAESWRSLINRIRHLLLVAYSKAITRLEDYVRQQRERRNESGWNFMDYFHLQEELAQILEMLGLYDEALVQYDELDILFSQFVNNGLTNETNNWLIEFQKPLERWNGFTLNRIKLPKQSTLLELRAYLFGKQAQMLLGMKNIWEIASRCLPFLHTCVREITLLEISSPPGALSCWLFLAAMEILQICDKFNNAGEVENYSLHTASLWAYASQKLRNLGELCGLMPNGTPTSEQLHIVVGLSAGMGDNPGTPDSPSPTDKLKEALCSQDVFNRTYLELAELAMCTYKHIGRLRSARLIGKQVASFYLLLNETQKAAAFLNDLLRTFEQDKWNDLIAQTQIELAECYRKSNDLKKFIKCASIVCAANEIDTLIRWTYFDEIKKVLETFQEPIQIQFDTIIKIVNINLKNDRIIQQYSQIIVEITIESNFPRELLCNNVLLTLEHDTKENKHETGLLTTQELKTNDFLLEPLKIRRHLDYKQDKQLSSANVVCKYLELKRKDSSIIPVKSDFNWCLQANNLPLMITPGVNTIRLATSADNKGRYYLGQLALYFGNLHLLSPFIKPHYIVDIKQELPSVRLDKSDAPLLSGVEQIMTLVINTGSYIVDPQSKIILSASLGLSFQIDSNAPLLTNLELEIGKQALFTTRQIPLRILADLLTKDHQVTINCPWHTKPIIVKLTFTPPLIVNWRLHTVQQRKFIQINLINQNKMDVIVENPQINVGSGGSFKIIDCNMKSSQIIVQDLNLVYVWELLVPKCESPKIKSEFSVSYRIDGLTDGYQLFKYYFDIVDYQTLYMLEATVEPTTGNEFCRDGTLCHLNLKIRNSDIKSHDRQIIKSVMYEVLAEPSVWAVCGRTAGVISFDDELQSQSVVLDVMPLISGYLPLPLVRISKYIPGEVSDKSGKTETHPRLEPFSPGQVYNLSKGKQVHVINAANDPI